MNYFTGDYFIGLQGDIIEYIKAYHKDSLYYSDFIEILNNNDINRDIILDLIDRDYIYDFMEHTKMYADISNKVDIDEILNEDYTSYFMDCSLSEVLDYFKEVSFIDVLIMTDIYKYNDMYYIIWEI